MTMDIYSFLSPDHESGLGRLLIQLDQAGSHESRQTVAPTATLTWSSICWRIERKPRCRQIVPILLPIFFINLLHGPVSTINVTRGCLFTWLCSMQWSSAEFLSIPVNFDCAWQRGSNLHRPLVDAKKANCRLRKLMRRVRLIVLPASLSRHVYTVGYTLEPVIIGWAASNRTQTFGVDGPPGVAKITGPAMEPQPRS